MSLACPITLSDADNFNIRPIDMVLRLFNRRMTSFVQSRSLLPTKISSPRRSPVGFPKRYARTCVLVTIFLVAVVFFYGPGIEGIATLFGYHRRPPLYGKYHEYEDQLPQHNLELPYPEGRDAKYFWVSNHVDSACWLLVCVHLN